MITRIVLKDFNPGVLHGQLDALSIESISWAGFERVSERVYRPFAAASRVIGKSTGQPDDIAQRGELRFYPKRRLTLSEEAALDSLLASHDATTRSPEQQRMDQDSADRAALRGLYLRRGTLDAAERRTYMDLIARLLLRSRDDEEI